MTCPHGVHMARARLDLRALSADISPDRAHALGPQLGEGSRDLSKGSHSASTTHIYTLVITHTVHIHYTSLYIHLYYVILPFIAIQPSEVRILKN